MLSFCVFKNKLHLNTTYQQQIITLPSDDALADHLDTTVTPKTIVTLAGPYPFTKLRILLSTAKGLAAGYGVPCRFIKTFDFLSYVFPDTLIALETRRGDYFTFHKDLGEQLLTKEAIEALPYPTMFDQDFADMDYNLAAKLLEFYPRAKLTDDPHYFYTPEYRKAVSRSLPSQRQHPHS